MKLFVMVMMPSCYYLMSVSNQWAWLGQMNELMPKQINKDSGNFSGITHEAFHIANTYLLVISAFVSWSGS
jgi:hypothetical protein